MKNKSTPLIKKLTQRQPHRSISDVLKAVERGSIFFTQEEYAKLSDSEKQRLLTLNFHENSLLFYELTRKQREECNGAGKTR